MLASHVMLPSAYPCPPLPQPDWAQTLFWEGRSALDNSPLLIFFPLHCLLVGQTHFSERCLRSHSSADSDCIHHLIRTFPGYMKVTHMLYIMHVLPMTVEASSYSQRESKSLITRSAIKLATIESMRDNSLDDIIRIVMALHWVLTAWRSFPVPGL